MDQYYVFMIIKSVISVIIALLLGNGTVVWFNNMPVRWFQEEGENLPSSLIADIESERQRLPSTPWKIVSQYSSEQAAYFCPSGNHHSL